MVRNISVTERRQEILDRVNGSGRVAVTELSDEFGVSEVTIRADLQALAESNFLMRTHGGAIPHNAGLQVFSLAMRRQQQAPEKDRIGAGAAAMIGDGDAVVLDSSSTALAISQHLKDRRYLTVITNSLSVAQELLDAPGVTVVLPGGTLRRDTASLVGAGGLAMLSPLNLQKGFFGAHGITLGEGLTDVSAEEAEVKRPLVRMCRQVIAVVDATKWGRLGLASFASLEEVHTIVTDSHAPADQVAAVRDAGIEVVLV
jgi:DeoR family transcriptional regulator of aga operon/DeoR family fructose operon transcriptional repressor